MKRFLSVILAIVILFTSVPSIPLNAVSAQEVPNDPNQAYPIDGPGSGPEEDETLPEDPINPTYNPNDAYPVDNGDDPESGTPFDIPAEYVEFPELLPGQSPETEAQLPLPEMEMVEIYQPPLLEAESKPPRITVSVEPQIYVENKPIEISWQINTFGLEGTKGKNLRFYLVCAQAIRLLITWSIMTAFWRCLLRMQNRLCRSATVVNLRIKKVCCP